MCVPDDYTHDSSQLWGHGITNVRQVESVLTISKLFALPACIQLD